MKSIVRVLSLALALAGVAAPALYAGGTFAVAGGVPASRIAKWDGTQWSAIGSGMKNVVHQLTVFDDGSGPALYAGGNFTTAGGVTAVGRIAAWRCAGHQ